MAERLRRSSRRTQNPVDYNLRGPRIFPYGNSARTQRRNAQRAREQALALPPVPAVNGQDHNDDEAVLSLVCIFDFLSS